MRTSESRLKVISEKMQMISDDTESDVISFQGKPFNGKTVGEYFGVIGAQIQALALSVQEIVDGEIQSREDERKKNGHDRPSAT